MLGSGLGPRAGGCACHVGGVAVLRRVPPVRDVPHNGSARLRRLLAAGDADPARVGRLVNLDAGPRDGLQPLDDVPLPPNDAAHILPAAQHRPLHAARRHRQGAGGGRHRRAQQVVQQRPAGLDGAWRAAQRHLCGRRVPGRRSARVSNTACGEGTARKGRPPRGGALSKGVRFCPLQLTHRAWGALGHLLVDVDVCPAGELDLADSVAPLAYDAAHQQVVDGERVLLADAIVGGHAVAHRPRHRRGGLELRQPDRLRKRGRGVGWVVGGGVRLRGRLLTPRRRALTLRLSPLGAASRRRRLMLLSGDAAAVVALRRWQLRLQGRLRLSLALAGSRTAGVSVLSARRLLRLWRVVFRGGHWRVGRGTRGAVFDRKCGVVSALLELFV